MRLSRLCRLSLAIKRRARRPRSRPHRRSSSRKTNWEKKRRRKNRSWKSPGNRVCCPHRACGTRSRNRQAARPPSWSDGASHPRARLSFRRPERRARPAGEAKASWSLGGTPALRPARPTRVPPRVWKKKINPGAKAAAKEKKANPIRWVCTSDWALEPS